MAEKGQRQIKINYSKRPKDEKEGIFIVKPWSKSESKPLSQQAPKSNKSPPKKEKRRIWTLG